MLTKNFNKLGGTEFRVKSQVEGYIWVAEFLLNEINKNETEEFDKEELNRKFKIFSKEEQVYNYKNDKKIKDRLSMVLKLFKQIGLVHVSNKKLIISKNKIEKFLEDPIKNIFKLFYENFPFFNKAMRFILENDNIDPFILSSTILVFENNKDDFSKIYNKFLNNYEDTINQIVLENFNISNKDCLIPENYKRIIRKPSESSNLIYNILCSMKNKNQLSEEDIIKIKETELIKNYLIPLKVLGFSNKRRRLNESDKNKINNYFRNVEYKTFIFDVIVARYWALIGHEYNDLIKRWLNDFGLIKDNLINSDHISFFEGEIEYKSIIEDLNEFPYTLNQISKNLLQIQENDFSFKIRDTNLKNVPNSTIAEYFVNLYIAQKNSISPNDFKIFSRTKLKPRTLLPLSHAPGKGPDMFLIKNNELTIFETTIHKTEKQIVNNEIFNIIEHVDLDKISYISNQERLNLFSTKIVLITLIKNEEQLSNIKEKLDYNYNNEKYNCGKVRNSIVTNFKKLSSLFKR